MSVIDMVQAIRDGRLKGKQMTVEQRRSCVQYLGSEGLTVPEIAQMLRCSDRTIARDRAAIQEAMTLEPDPKLAGRFAGKLVAEAEASMARIRRFTRDREASIGSKIEGERASFEILCKLSEQLQRLGFLPNHAGSMQIGIHHQAEQVPSSEEIDREIERLMIAAERGGADESTMQQLTELRQLADRAKSAKQLQGIERLASPKDPVEQASGDEA
jgi:hypothetical protein